MQVESLHRLYFVHFYKVFYVFFCGFIQSCIVFCFLINYQKVYIL